MIEVKGKSNIVVRVICDSISPNGVRLTTLECEYPRIIHQELLTHRMLSRNSASSRAIPFEKMKETLKGIPVRFGAANKGMQDKGEDYSAKIYRGWIEYSPEGWWGHAKWSAIGHAEEFHKAGFAKQIVNRLVEPFQMMKTVISATEWANFFSLRIDEAADPTIQELARCMKRAMDKSSPDKLQYGKWHLPYVTDGEKDCTEYTNDDLIKMSVARCAAVSFRNTDYPLAKCKEVYDRLVGDKNIHGSALEHCARPVYDHDAFGSPAYSISYPPTWPSGVSHIGRDGSLWSGNFRGWIQYRKLIPNESK